MGPDFTSILEMSYLPLAVVAAAVISEAAPRRDFFLKFHTHTADFKNLIPNHTVLLHCIYVQSDSPASACKSPCGCAAKSSCAAPAGLRCVRRTASLALSCLSRHVQRLHSVSAASHTLCRGARTIHQFTRRPAGLGRARATTRRGRSCVPPAPVPSCHRVCCPSPSLCT